MRNPVMTVARFDDNGNVGTSFGTTGNLFNVTGAFTTITDSNNPLKFHNTLTVDERLPNAEMLSKMESDNIDHTNENVLSDGISMPGGINRDLSNQIDEDSATSSTLYQFVANMYAESNTTLGEKLSSTDVNTIYEQIKDAKFVYTGDSKYDNVVQDGKLWIDKDADGNYDDVLYYDLNESGVYETYNGSNIDDIEKNGEGAPELLVNEDLTLADVIRSTLGTKAQINITKDMEYNRLNAYNPNRNSASEEEKYQEIQITAGPGGNIDEYTDIKDTVTATARSGNLLYFDDTEGIPQSVKISGNEDTMYTLNRITVSNAVNGYSLFYKGEDTEEEYEYQLLPTFFDDPDDALYPTGTSENGVQAKQVKSLSELFANTVWEYDAINNVFRNKTGFAVDYDGSVKSK